jgi:HEAT repeat protein
LALVSIGDTSALETVVTLLLHGDDYSRRAAAEALANHPNEGHAMLKDGATMEDMLVRHSVVYGLARIDQTWAVQILEKMQAEDDQWNVRNSAGEMLNRKHQLNPHIPQPLPPPHESTWLVEFASAQGIGISPGALVTDILLLALKSEDEDIRMAALPYLRHSPTKDVIAAIYQAMYGNDIEFREAAYNIIREIAESGIPLPAPYEFGVRV